jgi:hypothetical protein
MPSPTEDAIRIIDAAPEHGPLLPAQYASALPPEASALSLTLTNKRVVVAAKDYQDADARALSAQKWFSRVARTAAYSGFLAAVVGGLLLYLRNVQSMEALEANLGLFQSTLLSVSLLCAFALFLIKPHRTWRDQRASAEVKRLQVFALIMSDRADARASGVPLLPLQLECFRRHLLFDQRDYFERRGRQQLRTVRFWQFFAAVAFLLVLASLLPQVRRLDALARFPDLITSTLSVLPLDRNLYVLTGLVGGSLQALLAALAVMSPAQRNADVFREMLSRLDMYTADELNSARTAAAVGDSDAVGQFATRVSEILAQEGNEWLILQRILLEMAPKRLAQQGHGVGAELI